MKKLFFLGFVLAFNTIAFAISSTANKTKIEIAVTTSNIAEIVLQIGATSVNVNVLTDPKISQKENDSIERNAETIQKSNLILRYGSETWVDKFKENSEYKNKIYKIIKTQGNLMIPYLHIRASEEIKTILSNIDPKNTAYYQDNAANYVYNIHFTAEKIKKDLSKAYGVKIIANQQIKDLLEDYGFDIIAIYGNELTGRKLAYLMNTAKRNGIKMIVGSLQETSPIGKIITEKTKIPYIAVSNITIENSYIDTLRNNADKLKKILD
ncbi:MAG: metal ABC transporter substrate-binding protein [Bacteroidales bacterium]|jgi:ABC-type Zn uptake system ZnuABC Zn-binding protein ZnuA|nr:metal ABC transporter substrate-binding protein [Bacteroidales bacterium]